MLNEHVSLGHTMLIFRRAERPRPQSDVSAGLAPPQTPTRPADDAIPFWSSLPSRGMKVDDHAYGLPLHCLRAVEHAPQDRTDYRVLKGWTLSMGEIWIPRRVLWPGLLADTTFFAALWWALLIAPGITRRALRRRRGQCPTCAYDLRATPPSNPCPECGHKPEHRNPASAF